jgi:hypothetical protein
VRKKLEDVLKVVARFYFLSSCNCALLKSCGDKIKIYSVLLKWRVAVSDCYNVQVTVSDCYNVQVTVGDCYNAQVTVGDCYNAPVTVGDCYNAPHNYCQLPRNIKPKYFVRICVSEHRTTNVTTPHNRSVVTYPNPRSQIQTERQPKLIIKTQFKLNIM